MTIGKVAKQAGVNVQTVRYYEWRDLIPEPPRNDIGHRQHDDGAERRLYFIKRA
jgi:DNA-binding transcriptional MerR regulator